MSWLDPLNDLKARMVEKAKANNLQVNADLNKANASATTPEVYPLFNKGTIIGSAVAIFAAYMLSKGKKGRKR